MHCIVTLINQCSYLPYMGMMMKSYFNKLVLDQYLAKTSLGTEKAGSKTHMVEAADSSLGREVV